MNITQDPLSSWRLWQEAQSLSERTICERANVIRHLLSSTGAGALAITPDDIIAFTAQAHLTSSSKATYHATIRAYCLWLVKTGRRADNPALMTPTPKRVRGAARPISTNQLSVMLEVANRRRTRMMILLAAGAGLRVHEVAKFHGGDLDRGSGILTVTGKGGSTQMIPADESIMAEQHLFPVDGYWFPSYTGPIQHVSRSAVYQAIAGTMKRAGIVATPHQIRHWYGTTLLDEGVDVRIVQEMMRHKTLATTQLYTRVHMRQMMAGSRRLRVPAAA